MNILHPKSHSLSILPFEFALPFGGLNSSFLDGVDGQKTIKNPSRESQAILSVDVQVESPV